MLDFEGSRSEHSRRSKHQFFFEEEDNDMLGLDFSMASVSENDWEANTDNTISASFSVQLSVVNFPIPSSDVAFFNAINMRVEMCKFSTSIGSCDISYEPCSVLDIDKP